MTGIMSWIQNTYHSVMQSVGLEKAPAPSQADLLSDVLAEDVKASSISEGETVKVAGGNKGTANIRLADPVETQKANWNQAANGNNLVAVQNQVKAGVSPTTAIFDYLSEKSDVDYTQKNNIADFMEAVMNHGQVESNNSQWQQASLLDVLSEGIQEQGITDQQVDLIANGDYSASAYIDMVKDGKPIA